MKTSSTNEFVIDVDNGSDPKTDNSDQHAGADSMEGDGYNSDNGSKAPDAEKELRYMEEEAALGMERMLAEENHSDDGAGQPSRQSRRSSAGQPGSRDPPVFSSQFGGSMELYKCSECPYETYNMATLTSHQKIHKLYQCDICQMKFSHAANMRRHRMRHTGFKPFECRVCLKRFFRKDHLMEHAITHSKQLPFQCPMCDKRFDRQVYFKAHLQTDHWNLPSDKICGICGHKAATIKGAKLHYTTRHARAANTVNSNSPANSRHLAEESLGEVTRTSLMSARLERGPTLLTRLRHPVYASPTKSESGGDRDGRCGIGSSDFPSSSSPSQLLFPGASQLLSDTLAGAFAVPLTVSGLQGGGPSAGTFTEGLLAAVASSRGSPLQQQQQQQQQYRGNDHHQRRQLTSSVTLQRIAGGSSPNHHQNHNQNHQPHHHRRHHNYHHRYGGGGGGGGEHSEPGSPPDPSLVVKTEMEDSRDGDEDNNNNNKDGSGSSSSSSSELSDDDGGGGRGSSRAGPPQPPRGGPHSPRSEVGSGGRGARDGSPVPSPTPAFATSSMVHRQVSVGDVTITPLGGVLACGYCGIVFPDQTLYFLHKGVHSESNPWKCNICGELCRDKYDFNTHILSKAHQ